MKSIWLSTVFLFLAIGLYAQSDRKHEHTIGLAVGNGTGLTALRAEYLHYWGLGERGRFKIGLGARTFYGFASDQRFATVNTSNNGDGDPEQDALQVAQVGIGGLNAVLGIKFSFNAHWDLGLRFDVVGLGFGAGQGANFQDISEASSQAVATQAPNPNIAFTRGQVMSDNLWLGYTFGDHHQLSLSFAFLGAEYEWQDAPANLEDPRFERIHQMGFLGYAYRW